MTSISYDYVRLPGSVVGTPPYSAKNTLMHAMVVRGQREKQQVLCDAMLNWRGADGPHFRVMSDRLLLTAIYSDSMGSLDPVERGYGVMREVDIGFWSLVMATGTGGLFDRRLMWMPSFLFVDTAAAMAAGREVFGYPKTASMITRGSDDNADPAVKVQALHFPRFSEDARPEEDVILELASGDGHAEGAKELDVATAVDQLTEAFDPAKTFAERLSFPEFGMPQVMLRQMRDPTGASRAALKEILILTPKPKQARSAGLLVDNPTVHITRSASHDIRSTLGLCGQNESQFGVWLNFDFEVGWAERI